MSKLPKEIRDGLYSPSFTPDTKFLNEFITNTQQQKQQTNQSLKKKIKQKPQPPKPTQDAPLTEEEAEAVDEYIQSLRKRISSTKQRIFNLRKIIDENASLGSADEFNLKLDISNKPSVKQAIRYVFGIKTDTITYSMYKAALELKHQIELEEANNYVYGDK